MIADEKTNLRNAWQPFLNVMQLIDMEIEIARTCMREPKNLFVGRKEMYELKRDWSSYITTQNDGSLTVRNLTVVQVDQTSFLRVS